MRHDNARRRIVILCVLALTGVVAVLISLERSGEARIAAASVQAARSHLESHELDDLRADMVLAVTVADASDDAKRRARAEDLATALARGVAAFSTRGSSAQAAALRRSQNAIEKALASARAEPSNGRLTRMPVLPKVAGNLNVIIRIVHEIAARDARILAIARREVTWLRRGILAVALTMLVLLVFGASRKRPRPAAADAKPIDTLTGLADRIAFSQLITARIAPLSEYAESADAAAPSHHVILVDIRGFHTVNAAHGYKMGDALLRTVAERLLAAAGADTVARIGVDEYAILTATPRATETVLREAHRALDAIAEPVTISGKCITMTACAGVAPIAAHEDSDRVLRNVELALSTAKAAPSSANGTVRLFTREIADEYQAIVDEERRVLEALEGRRFLPYYQPIVDLGSMRTIGAEALVRWPLSTGEVIGPGGFLPKLEALDRLNDLTWIILEKACTVAARWPEELFVSVNVPPGQISVDFANDVIALLDRHDFAPHRLQLEILESGFADGRGHLTEAFDILRDTGVRIALDDFGVGYSSLGQLSRLPVDKVKIDRSFIQAIQSPAPECRSCTGPQGVPCALIRAAVDLCAAFDLEVVAEGVETKDQLTCVQRVGCSAAQGYYWGKPMPADEFGHWIAAEKASAAATRHDKRGPTTVAA